MIQNPDDPRTFYYYSSKAHSDRFILSFIHIFSDSQKCYFAYCIPYEYTKLQKYLLELEQRNLPFFKRDPLTHSVQEAKVPGF